MTDAEIQALADAMAAKAAQATADAASAAKAATAAKFAAVKTFVIHNATGIMVGSAATFVLLKFL